MNNVVVIEADKRNLSNVKRRVGELTSEVKNLRNEAKKLQKTEIVTEVFLNEDKFNKSFARTEKLLKQLTVSKFEVSIAANDVLLYKLHATMKQLTDRTQVVHMNIDFGGVLTGLRQLKGQLLELTSKKWSLTMCSDLRNNTRLGYADGTANIVQPSNIKQETDAANADTALDVIAPVADILTLYTAYDTIWGKVKDKLKSGTAKSSMNKLLTKVGSAITASGKINLAAGSKALTALSAGTVAGGIGTGAGAIEGIYHLANGVTANNDYDKNHEVAKGSTILGGTIIGAGIGSFFGPAGTLIGGGIGYLAGKAASSPIANAFTGGKVGAMKDAAVSPNAAKRLEELREKQAELAKSKLDEKFGSITLSAEQVAKATEKLFNPTQTARIYNAEIAASQLNEAFGALQQRNDSLRKDIWIASTEGQLSPQKSTELKSSVNIFGSEAENTLKEKQYSVNESVRAIMGDPKEGEGVINAINKSFQSQQEKFNKIETKLNKVTNEALADGKISKKEQNQIDNLMGELVSLTKGDDSEVGYKASLEKMDLDIKGDISGESFQQIMAAAMQSAGQRKESLESSYANVAEFANDDQKKILRWGEDDKGDKAGLYHQESEMYLDLAKVSIDNVLGKLNNKELGFLTKDLEKGESLSDNILDGGLIEYLTKQGLNESGGLSKEVGKPLSELDAGTKAVLGELADGLGPVLAELSSKAELYEEHTGKIPDEMQNIFKFVDMLNHVSDNNGANWFFENAGENAKKKFNLSDYNYLIPPAAEALPQPAPQAGSINSIGLPQSPQVSLDGNPVIEGQSSITAADFGIPPFISTTVDVYIKENRIIGDPPKDFESQKTRFDNYGGLKQVTGVHEFRGGIVGGGFPGFAEGGYVRGGAQLITVAEEGTPEAIIPLGRHRRKRAMELFSQVGSYLQAPGFSPKGFAAGGIVGGSIGGGFGGGMPAVVEVGGVEIKVEAKDGQNLVETIRENKEAISEEIAGVFNAAFKGQFANTPASGGVSA